MKNAFANRKLSSIKNNEEIIVPIVLGPADDGDSIVDDLHRDTREKKKAIYHYPTGQNKIGGMAFQADYRRKCGDTYEIKLGYPMTWVEYSKISTDDTKRMYIESILEKYPGISTLTIAHVFGLSRDRNVKFELRRLGIKFDYSRVGNKSIQIKYNKEITEIQEAIKNGDISKNSNVIFNNPPKRIVRKTYRDLKKMSNKDAREYLETLYSRYDRTLGYIDFMAFLDAARTTVCKFFKAIDFNIDASRGGVYNNEKIIRDKFYSDFKLTKIKDPTYNRPAKKKEDKESITATNVVRDEITATNVVDDDIPINCINAQELDDIIDEIENGQAFDGADIDNVVVAKVEEDKNNIATDGGDIMNTDRKVPILKVPADVFDEIGMEDEDSVPEEDNDFIVNSIELVVDTKNIKTVLDSLGISGKVKIRVEKV